MHTGPDISHWQSQVDWAKLTPAVDFIALKATQGTHFVDSTFGDRWRGAERRHLPRIAYHYYEIAKDPVDQADHFVEVVRAAGVGGKWACALDFEDPAPGGNAQDLWDWASAWVQWVRHLTGKPVAFYAYPSYLRDRMATPAKMPGGPETVDWIARYTTSPDPWVGYQRPAAYPAFPSIWQCSNGLVGCVTDVPGLGKVDWNRMNDAAYARMFERSPGDPYNVDEVVKAIQEAATPEVAIEIERHFVEDTPEADAGVTDAK